MPDAANTPPPKRDRGNFRRALSKLASDPEYRTLATADPQRLVNDFQLTASELEALRQAAIMSGADVTSVDVLRAESIRKDAFARVNNEDVTELANGGVNVSCCSCCCCCCGETSVVTIVG
jgi:hypothetical protein